MTQIYWVIALVATGVFVVQFVLSLFFGDMDADTDAGMDAGSIVSFKGLVHFGIGFGWSMVLAGEATAASLLTATIIGLVFIFVLWYLYVQAYRLQTKRRAEKPEALVGRSGTIYNNRGAGRYVIQIPRNGSMGELDVVSRSGRTDYTTGERVGIEAYTDDVYYIS